MELAEALTRVATYRASRWAAEGAESTVVHRVQESAKRSASLVLRTASHVGQLTVWSSGEVELTTMSLVSGERLLRDARAGSNDELLDLVNQLEAAVGCPSR